MDESYFGAGRVRGRKGRGAFGKIIVFGLKKRKGNVYTQVIKNCSKTEILPLISSNPCSPICSPRLKYREISRHKHSEMVIAKMFRKYKGLK